MENSILVTTKKLLGITEEDTSFDLDILLHINSAFSDLNQIGVGPKAGFLVEDAGAKWVDFLGVDPNLNRVKTYVYLKTRLAFDPPTTTALLSSVEKQILEAEWRLKVYVENLEWELLGLAPPCTTYPESPGNLVTIYQHAKE